MRVADDVPGTSTSMLPTRCPLLSSSAIKLWGSQVLATVLKTMALDGRAVEVGSKSPRNCP
jgi:hypothetical protein